MKKRRKSDDIIQKKKERENRKESFFSGIKKSKLRERSKNKCSSVSRNVLDRFFSSLQKSRGGLSKSMIQRNRSQRRHVLPENFSFIEKPETVISTISQVAYEAKCGAKVISFSHRNVKRYDPSAEFLLGMMASYIRSKYGRRIRLNGVYPSDEDHRNMIKTVGIANEISSGDEEVSGKIKVFKRD